MRSNNPMIPMGTPISRATFERLLVEELCAVLLGPDAEGSELVGEPVSGPEWGALGVPARQSQSIATATCVDPIVPAYVELPGAEETGEVSEFERGDVAERVGCSDDSTGGGCVEVEVCAIEEEAAGGESSTESGAPSRLPLRIKNVCAAEPSGVRTIVPAPPPVCDTDTAASSGETRTSRLGSSPWLVHVNPFNRAPLPAATSRVPIGSLCHVAYP